jgi:zinc transporter ZupT
VGFIVAATAGLMIYITVDEVYPFTGYFEACSAKVPDFLTSGTHFLLTKLGKHQ